ncbi:MAG: anti-sigma factor [Chloroflexi bacterium]|nr:anti-sigma factor [Chloroflexota bacterium]
MNDEHNTGSRPDDADRLRDDLAAFSLGAADSSESTALEKLLSERPDLRAEAARFAAQATVLLSDVPRRQPSSDLKARILSAARTEPDAHSPSGRMVALPQPSSRAAPGIRGALLWLSSTAAVVLLALCLYMFGEVNALRSDRANLESLRGDLTQQVDAMYKDLAMAVDLVMQTQSRRVELMSDDGEMRAMVVLQPEMHEAVIVTHGLPALSPDQTYQLWMIGPEGVVSTCMFNTDPGGDMTMVFKVAQSWDNVSALGISVEPQGGSEAPTSEPLAVGEL